MNNVELVAGRVGAFEITVDADVQFSKLATHRFPTDDEIDKLGSG